MPRNALPPNGSSRLPATRTTGITDLTLNNTAGAPEGAVKDIFIETPAGLSVNPEALPQCSLAQAEADITECPPTTLVGLNYLTVVVAPGPTLARKAAPVYNVEPFFGHPSMVAFPNSAEEAVYVVGSLDPVDQHVNFAISDLESPLEGGPPLVRTRLVFDEGEAVFGPGMRSGNGTYLTLPSQCGTTADATVKVDSHEGAADQATFTTPYVGEGCDKVPFDPTIETTVDSATDSPEPVTLDLGIPFDPEQPIANSYLKKANDHAARGSGAQPLAGQRA